MILIDTSNTSIIREFERKKDDLDYELRQKGHYDVHDFVIVRATNFLNSKHTMQPTCQIPFVVNTNNIAHSAIHNILRKKYNINIETEEKELKNFEKLTYQYSPLSTQYRSTTHCTLNGLVSNHSKGSFDDKNFIIIDNLIKHLGINDIRSIRMEDLFFLGEVPISNEAIILINEEKYEQLAEKFTFLNTYNIVLFKGDEKLATEILLTHMNIVPEKISEHSAEESKRTQLHHNFFKSIEDKYGIKSTKHFYSPEYAEDDQKNILLWQIYDTNFYNELFDNFSINKEEKDKMIAFLTSNIIDRDEKTEMLQNFIMKIGLENYQNFVIAYNNNIHDSIVKGIYPTNEEILTMGYIELKNNKKTL